MDLSAVELIGMMAGTGGVTGGVTLAGLRVHIQYLREADRRQAAELDAMRARCEKIEMEQLSVVNMAKSAHKRIDKLESVA